MERLCQDRGRTCESMVMNHVLMAAGCLTGIAILLPAQATARDPADRIPDEMQLLQEETVITSVRYEQPISESPSNIYVITDEDIQRSGATDIPTILRRVPGLEVIQVTAADFNVSARGDNQLGANKMLVMVDGRSIYVDVQGTVFWKMLPVTLPEIKRIEVLKGPAAAVWGFNAFDGVINIITKSAQEMRGTTLQFGGGEYGTISSAAIQAGTAGNLGYRLSVGHDQNAKWRARDSLGFRSNKFNAQGEYAFSNLSKLTLSGGLVDVNNFDGPVFGDTFDVNHKVSQGYANATYEHGEFLVRAFWNHFDSAVDTLANPLLFNAALGGPLLRVTDRTGNSRAGATSDTYNIDLQHVKEIFVGHRLTSGVNYRHNTLSSNVIAQFAREDRLGVFIQDEWKATQNFTVVAGARYDLHTEINGTISPRIALLYRLAADHTLRVALSVGYRPPTIFEASTDLNTIALPGLPPPFGSIANSVRGSSKADPEQIISYEAGYQGWFFKHRLRMRADLFFNHISDLISFRPVSPTLTTAVNSGEADIYGGEAGGEFLATKWLTVFANFSYQEIGQTLTGSIRRGAPRFKFNAGLRGDWENGLSGEALLHHYGSATYPMGQAFSTFSTFGIIQSPSTRVGSYNLLNLRGAYRFWQHKAAAGYMREAEVAISAFNSLNDKHQEHPLGDMIGSRVMGWLTVRF